MASNRVTAAYTANGWLNPERFLNREQIIIVLIAMCTELSTVRLRQPIDQEVVREVAKTTMPFARSLLSKIICAAGHVFLNKYAQVLKRFVFHVNKARRVGKSLHWYNYSECCTQRFI